MKVDAYLIRCLTNMHVGVGGTNYDIIDNMVQRDVITEVPTIYSSSLKGALREFFKNKWGENNEKLNYIFGPDLTRQKERDENKKSNIGHYNFFAADLLSLPVQAKDKPFQHTSSKFLLEHINSMKNQLNIDNDVVKKAFETFLDKDVEIDWKQEQCGSDVGWKSKTEFKRIAKKLPVIARNKLENGESKNLFYEEVVPRETHFVFFVAKPEDEKYSKDFDDALKEQLVQIGANGSIGYGFCKISKIS